MDEKGCETKRLSYRDIDAVFKAHRVGLRLALVTGEDTPWVDMIARRLKIALVYAGAKDKGTALRLLSSDTGTPLDKVAYVGDSDRDGPALALVGLGLVPSDAAPSAKQAADVVLGAAGGKGVVEEAVGFCVDSKQYGVNNA
jgi:YrbI family 3-deoxy-D-manno-octulosonate 8-phosphate phosphatase